MTRLDRRLLAGLFCLIMLALGLVWAGISYAYTCNATGCTWNTKYTEPSTLTNAQPLTDLTGCTASYTIAVDGGTPATPRPFTIPASRPTGGGVISVNNTDPTMVPNHVYTIAETLTCNSTAFGTSAATVPVMLPMNNGVTTNPGTGLTIQ